MIPNATVQHRVKHFDLLLARELEFIEREHEQNLITHHKLERTIRREQNANSSSNFKKPSIPFDEIHQSMPRSSIHNSDDKLRISIVHTRHPIGNVSSSMSPRYQRHCTKAHRLPPLIKLNSTNRLQAGKDIYWTAAFQQMNTSVEIFHEIADEISLPEITPIQKQIHSFMETLPTYKGVQKGFDNFGPSSLYSRRAPVAMR